MTARRWGLVVALVLVALVAAGVWLAVSARAAYAELSSARDDLLRARDAIAAQDGEEAAAATAAAAESASAAAGRTSGPLWDVAAAIPKLGDTPGAVQTIAASLDQALSALAPAVSDVAELTADRLIADDGSIDGAAIDAALPPLKGAQAGVAQASTTLAEAPAAADGALLPAQVEDARAQLTEQLEALGGSLDSLVAAAEIAPPLLGVGEPKRYFVAVLNPNEARGTGGFIGTWAILSADGGRLTVEQVGANEDLPRFETLPIDLGDDFAARYGRDANEVGNMNLSPHFPNAAQLWLAAWEEKTGERLDGAISADVVALGELIDAGGGSVPLPEGGRATGTELTDLAITGIYDKFPSEADSLARSAYQVDVTGAAAEVAADGLAEDPRAVSVALGRAISDRRIQAWVRDPALEEKILATELGGSLAVPDGPSVTFVALNSSGSKLDAWLERSAMYDVGRCADGDGQVRSQFSVTLTNTVPAGVAPYVISQAEVGPDGPINTTLAQVHLPIGARILSVAVDDEPAFHSPFTEQGRPSTVLDVELPPGEPRTLTVDFLEPAVDRPAQAPEQPLATPMETTLAERGC